MKTNFMNKKKDIYGWVKNSNHIQLIARMFAAIVVFILASVIVQASTVCIIMQSIVVALLTSLLLELNNKKYGVKFDYNNLIAAGAGCVLAIILYVLLLIIF